MKLMKSTKGKKPESTMLFITTPKGRMPRIIQRAATFKSGKTYNRKGKKGNYE